jgi:hypothetical protein
LNSAIERIRKLLRLTSRERRLLLYAWWLFGLVGPALRVLPVTRLLPRRPAAGAGRASLPVERIAWLVRVAGRHAPGRVTCLEEALVLAWMLRREGVDATVRIGVARDDRGLRAHAWLEYDGRVIFGSSEDDTYQALLPTADVAPSR